MFRDRYVVPGGLPMNRMKQRAVVDGRGRGTTEDNGGLRSAKRWSSENEEYNNDMCSMCVCKEVV